MRVGQLKQLLKDIPDNVEICITDMCEFTSDFELSSYHDETQTYIDLIMPKYIGSYNNEDSDEQVVLY